MVEFGEFSDNKLMSLLIKSERLVVVNSFYSTGAVVNKFA
jgi:hypothetical protein